MRLETLRIGMPARIALMLAVLGVSAMAIPACGSDESPADPGAGGGGTGGVEQEAGPDTATCQGIVDDAGNCVAKCEDSMCNTGNVCVENACKFTCTAHIGCPSGYQCTGAGKKDSDGSDVFLCEPASAPMGEGEYMWPCPNGTECNQDPSWICLGVGPGDADAYCTKYDCQDDADCPGGMWCGVLRDFHAVCGDPDFPLTGDPEPGDCVDPAEFTTNGKTFRLGPATLLRNACVRRGYCAECDTDLDCSLIAGNVCVKADANQKGYCSRSCEVGKLGCTWEGASTCGTADATKGDTCNPTYGACVGNKDVCTPCRNDDDCWDPSSPSVRMCLRSSFSGEPFCVDMDQPCKVNADCPKSPAGRQMQCLSDPAYDGSFLDDRCYPGDNGTPIKPGHPSCYPAP